MATGREGTKGLPTPPQPRQTAHWPNNAPPAHPHATNLTASAVPGACQRQLPPHPPSQGGIRPLPAPFTIAACKTLSHKCTLRTYPPSNPLRESPVLLAHTPAMFNTLPNSTQMCSPFTPIQALSQGTSPTHKHIVVSTMQAHPCLTSHPSCLQHLSEAPS